ncbi:MAG: hypothetical protein ACLFUS_00500 [Candidatus Sumerlaeia bacterium]
MRSRTACLILATLSLFILALPLAAQDALDTEYVAFWYEKMEDSDQVMRRQVSSTEYESLKEAALDGEFGLIQMYTEFLEGNFQNIDEYGYTEEEAQMMIQIDPGTQSRMQQSAAYRSDVIRQMAEWTLFYDQLELWNQYVEESVIREELDEDEQPEYNPATADSNLESMYRNLQNHAKNVSKELYKKYRNPSAAEPGLVDRIERAEKERRLYNEWLADRENEMMRFVDVWRRQYEGSEIRINDVQYLVRNIKDQPDDVNEDYFRDSLPDNAVLLEVPKEKMVTPFDLINEDGSLKTPDDQM